MQHCLIKAGDSKPAGVECPSIAAFTDVYKKKCGILSTCTDMFKEKHADDLQQVTQCLDKKNNRVHRGGGE